MYLEGIGKHGSLIFGDLSDKHRRVNANEVGVGGRRIPQPALHALKDRELFLLDAIRRGVNPS